LASPELAPFDTMARNSGTTLHEALQRYISAEQLLEHDPLAGLDWLARNYRVTPEQLLAYQQQKRRAA
jgi:hypothetical protein